MTVEYRDETPFTGDNHTPTELANAIRTKKNGKDVREPIAQLADKLSNAVLGQNIGSVVATPTKTFTSLSELQKAYPNGADGVMVTVDSGHKYFWQNNNWVDGGIYQSKGLTEEFEAIPANYASIVKETDFKKPIPLLLRQGRHTFSNGQVRFSAEDNDSLRKVRVTTQMISAFKKITIMAKDGYEFEILRDNGANTSWSTAFTVKDGDVFYINFRNKNQTNISFNDVIKNFDIFQSKSIFEYGNYIDGNFNESLFFVGDIFSKLNAKIDGAYSIDFDSSIYKAVNIFLSNSGNLDSSSLIKPLQTVRGKNNMLILSRIDGKNIELDESKNIKIKKLNNELSLENGSCSIDDNKYLNNDSEIALAKRLRSGIVWLESGTTISTNQKLSITKLQLVDNAFSAIENINWTKSYSVTQDGYYAFTLGMTDDSTLLSKKIIDGTLELKIIKNSTVEKFESYNVLVFGDSITEYNYSAKDNWLKRADKALHFASVKNLAVGGTGIVRGGTNSWLEKLKAIDNSNQYDLILVMGNMNDFSQHGEGFTMDTIGTFEDEGNTTQYGAVKTFVKKLQEKFPTTQIGWITSQPRQYLSSDSDADNPVTSDGYLYGKKSVFEKANGAIKEVCEDRSIPVLDLFHNSGFNIPNEQTRLTYFYNDGNLVHPNDKGHEILAKKIISWIRNNF
ncbi:SGNH/GDSL hydrolase family protein [Ligilactobacillus salivarius]|uniref:SGNH/GDSL hydrolase family protein n=1 Tax=Ligilactobacillus salivarius TaxID=1624 RepID=UPI002367B220|nr:SGNH/GDSL hydrolase family protein [Ligilactobacillus salivarius]